jgi:excisionase family DNA binding protein
MLTMEIRLLVSGQEISLDSFATAPVADIRSAVREEISRKSRERSSKNLGTTQQPDPKTPPLAVSRREAARLLGVSQRTLNNHVASKAIRCVRVGKRVLIPMRSLHEVVAKGIS